MGPFEYAVTLWRTIPGIKRVTAFSLVVEVVNMNQFPSPEHPASDMQDLSNFKFPSRVGAALGKEGNRPTPNGALLPRLS